MANAGGLAGMKHWPFSAILDTIIGVVLMNEARFIQEQPIACVTMCWSKPKYSEKRIARQSFRI
jgi:hypothetical protein